MTKNVPFNEGLLETVGFIIGDRYDGKRGPIGTFFIIQEERDGWDGQTDRGTVRWMITARHVIEGGHENGGHIEARMRSAWRHGQEVVDWGVDDGWEFAMDYAPGPGPSFDLAIRSLDREPLNTFKALPIGYAAPYSPLGEFFGAELGRPTYFAGLLDWEGPIAEQARPVVRSGTVAALRQTGIVWHTGTGSRRRAWTAPEVHLIDVRSRAGFSGSPCWIQWDVRGLDDAAEMVSEETMTWLRAQRNIGDVVAVSHWWGVFVAHDDDPGIGVVIPVRYVLDILNQEKIRAMKKKQEDKLDAADEKRGPKGQSVAGTPEEFDAFRSLTEKIVSVPKSEVDELRKKD